MAIVRELTTKLSFKTDDAQLRKFEKSIIGLKSKLTIAAASLTAFGKTTLNYFDNVATAAISTRDLARNTKTATEDFIKLRRAAEDFQLKPEQFEATFTKLAKGLRDARGGFGALFDIARKSEGKFNIQPFIKSGNTQDLFTALLDYLDKVEDVGDKLEIIRSTFVGDETAFQRIAEAGTGEFLKAAEANKKYSDSLLQTIPVLEKYQKTSNDFYKNLKITGNNLITSTAPIATSILKDFNKGHEEGGVFGGVLTTIFEPFKDLFNYISKKDDSGVLNSPTINSNIEINVNGSVTRETSEELAETIERKLDAWWDGRLKEVVNNNPVVE